MIRRAVWLAIGAALGIAGYRRVTRAAKALLPARETLTPLTRRAVGSGRAGPAPRRRADGGTAAFVRDVRAGMAEFIDRHSDV